MFNALKYTEILEKAGFTRDQAEKSINILIEIMDQNLSTKQDMQELKVAVQRDIQEFKVEFKRDLQELRTEFKHDLRELESRMTIKLGSIMAASIAIMTAVTKLL